VTTEVIVRGSDVGGSDVGESDDVGLKGTVNLAVISSCSRGQYTALPVTREPESPMTQALLYILKYIQLLSAKPEL
jgi:hypothetical protein